MKVSRLDSLSHRVEFSLFHSIHIAQNLYSITFVYELLSMHLSRGVKNC